MAGETFRQEKLRDFTVIRNAIFKDYSLSAKAVGVACKLLSLPPDWEYSVRGLVELFSDGESSIRSALNELEEHGYLKREQVRADGRFSKAVYTITDTLKCEIPCVENLTAGNTTAVNHAQLNTKELNTKESNTYTPPTIEEVRAYVEEKNLMVDADYFYEYYEDTGWRDKGGDPVKNWKLKCRTWHKREVKNGTDTTASDRQRGRVREAVRGSKEEPRITGVKLPPMAFGDEPNERGEDDAQVVSGRDSP